MIFFHDRGSLINYSVLFQTLKIILYLPLPLISLSHFSYCYLENFKKIYTGCTHVPGEIHVK